MSTNMKLLIYWKSWSKTHILTISLRKLSSGKYTQMLTNFQTQCEAINKPLSVYQSCRQSKCLNSIQILLCFTTCWVSATSTENRILKGLAVYRKLFKYIIWPKITHNKVCIIIELISLEAAGSVAISKVEQIKKI